MADVIDIQAARSQRTSTEAPSSQDASRAPGPPAYLDRPAPQLGAPGAALVQAGKVALKVFLIGAAVTGGIGLAAGWWFGHRSGQKSCRLRASKHLFE